MLHLLALMLVLGSDPQDTVFRVQGQVAAPQMPGAGNATPAPQGTATLRGRVYAADSGQPLRKAQVRIFAPDIRENRMATTDTDGKFEFTEVRAGRYTINASKGSYVGLSYGQQRPTDLGKPLQILDNQTVERLDFSLPHGSIVTGRIVDEFGEPMSDVQIAAQRYQFAQGQRRLVPAGRGASTDDLGEFRLFGIPPGQYYLSATWRNQNAMNPTVDDRTAYAPMYFPGTDNPAQAQRITLAVGQELSDIVMALKPMRATRVTGTVVTSDGGPMAGMVMVVSTAGGGFNFSSGGPVRPDGTFILNGLAPGEYTVRAQSGGMGGPDAETAMEKITATGADITDLRLVGAKPSTIGGRILVDPAAAAAMPSTVMVAPMPVDPGAMSFGGIGPGRMTDDGSFELKASPGRYRINFVNAPAGWTIRSVRLNGTDVTDSGIDCKPNENISGIEVELTNKPTTVSGLVTNARGETVKDYSAIAFAQDKEQWKGNTRYQGTGRPDQDGRFKITLPPGDYYVIALDKLEPGQQGDPDFLDTIRTKATVVTIREGDARTVDLKVNTGS